MAPGPGTRHRQVEPEPIDVPHHTRGGPGLPGHRHLEQQRDVRHRTRRARARAGTADHRRPAAPPWGRPGQRTSVHEGRRLARHAKARAPHLRLLAAQVRRRRRRRTIAERRWRPAGDHRGPAVHIPVPQREPGHPAAVAVRSREAVCRQLQLHGRGAAQARRDDRASQRRPGPAASDRSESLPAPSGLHAQDVRRPEGGARRVSVRPGRGRRRRQGAVDSAGDGRHGAAHRVRQRR